ncbi:MAG: hypothetical protein ACLPX5_17095, partial [Dissulfurispiraceae bacterium]
ESLGRGAIPLDCDLTFSNRPVRTRMPGGVGGVRLLGVPYPDQSIHDACSGIKRIVVKVASP